MSYEIKPFEYAVLAEFVRRSEQGQNKIDQQIARSFFNRFLDKLSLATGQPLTAEIKSGPRGTFYAWINDTPTVLTERELLLLRILKLHPTGFVDRTELQACTLGFTRANPDSIRQYVYHLRKKLRPFGVSLKYAGGEDGYKYYDPNGVVSLRKPT